MTVVGIEKTLAVTLILDISSLHKCSRRNHSLYNQQISFLNRTEIAPIGLKLGIFLAKNIVHPFGKSLSLAAAVAIIEKRINTLIAGA